MYRLYIPSLDMDVQHESLDILRSIVAEIRAGRCILQETGWVEVQSELVSRETVNAAIA